MLAGNKAWIGLAAGLLCLSGVGSGWGAEVKKPEDPWTIGKLFERGKVLLIPAQEKEMGRDEYKRAWDFTKEDRGNFTFFDKISNVHATAEGALAFTLTDKTGTLGWGNYAGAQPEPQRLKIWPLFAIKLEARQTAPAPTVVKFRFWESGKRDAAETRPSVTNRYTARIEGTNWQEIVYNSSGLLTLPRRDGFDLEVSGLAGNTIEFRNLRFVRMECAGYFRKELVLPDSSVWQALVEVGNQGLLYVNGREVPCQNIATPRPNWFGYDMYRSESLDIAPYLVAGQTNCIGLYGRRENYQPTVSLQGSVIMSSGERLSLDSDATWKWSHTAPDGWNQPGFNDAAWLQVSDEWRSGKTDKTNAVATPLWNANARAVTDTPVYDGYLALENPRDTLFFYSDQEDLVFRARIPRGLEKRQPVLEWIFSRYGDGKLAEVKRGTESGYIYDGKSLRYTVNLGRFAKGVYTLETRLQAGTNTLDQRLPEPLVVVGKIPTRWTDGDDYRQDLDLELEREIDLTKAQDGPWLEADGKDRPSKCITNATGGVATPTIVKRNGLTYRETRPAYGSIISYLVQFKHPGEFYLLEFDYPNDMERHMGWACCPRMWGESAESSENTYSKTSASVATGGRYPVTGRIQTLPWLYRPDPGNHALDLVNLSPNRIPAAGAKLRIYYIRNGLPALRAPEKHTRWNGYITENLRASHFSITKEPLPEGQAQVQRGAELWQNKTKLNPILELCKILEQDLDACEYFARYMRFVGQNIYLMGNFQYSDGMGIASDWPFPSPRLFPDVRGVLARVMRENNIDFYASVEFIFTTPIMSVAAKQPARPATGFWDTVYMVQPDGQEYSRWEGHYGLNFNHPLVRQEMLRVAEIMARKYRALPNFRGVSWTPYFGADFLPGYQPAQLKQAPLNVAEMSMLCFSDVTIQKFEQDTGLKVPFALNDPQRFKKRHAYLLSETMRPQWLAWRAESLKEFFSDVANTIHRQRADLNCVCNLYMNPDHEVAWHRSGLSFADFMLLNGWHGRLFQEGRNVWLTDTMYGKLNAAWGSGLYGWDMSFSPERYAFFSGEYNRAVQVKHDWLEIEQSAWALPYRPDWPRFFQLTLLEQPDGYNTAEVFTRGLIGADAELFYYGFADTTLFAGNEQPLREFNRVLRALPSERFKPVADTGLKTNLAIRELNKGEKTYCYAANPGYWPVSGSISLENAADVYDLVTGKVAARADKKGLVTVKFELKPFMAAAWVTPAETARVTAWKAAPQKGVETAHLEALVARVAGLLNLPAARAVLGEKDEAFMREAVTSAQADIKADNYAGALYATSSDRFWILKQDFMEKVAKYGTEHERSAQVSKELREAKAGLTDHAPVIDGKLDDRVWQKAEIYSGFISPDGMPAIAATVFQVAHDADNLYIAFQCKDRNSKDIKMKAVREKEGSVFTDDVVVMFIQPDPAVNKYYQMAVSAGGVQFDQKVMGGDRDYAFAPPWETKAAVTAEGWVAEIKLPAASLEGKLESGKPWGFNVHRCFRDAELPGSSWSYSPSGWHDPERFGKLQF